MFARLLLAPLFLVLSLLPLRAGPPDAAEVSATLRIAEMVAVMREEGLAYGTGIEDELFPGAGGARWAAAVDRVYDGTALDEGVQAAFAARLADDPETRQAIVDFFGNERGQRILSLELAARRALLDPAAEEAAQVTVDRMRGAGDPRLDLLARFAEANDLIEQNVSVALNANYAFYRGMADAGAFAAERLTEEEIISDVWSQESEIRADTETWLYPFLALAYQPLGDADLEAYIAFSESPAGQAMNTAMFAAFDEVFGGLSRELGRAAAEILSGQDI